ncbi:MAG: DHH family phosphoesterase [Candidatus Ornithomonoglobus sp.]
MKKAYSHAMRKYMIAAVTAAVILVLCAGILCRERNYILAGIQGAAGMAVITIVLILGKKRKETIAKYIHKILDDNDDISENAIISVPMPMAICSIDGTIRWYNDRFAGIFGNSKLPYEVLDDCIPKLKWSEVLKYPNGRTFETVMGDNTYSVHWNMIKDRIGANKLGDHYSVFFYLVDVTHIKQVEENYRNERVDIALINVDNYDEFAQKSDDDLVEAASGKIRAAVAAWAKSGNAVLKKTDRDRYFMAFEHRYLDKYISGNFTIVENVRQIAQEAKFPLSVSIGIGTGGNIADNETSARNALDLALGRGGGQVCVKDDTQFKFYGGKNGEYERSSRVKARAVASALRDFIAGSDHVIFMGHKGADYDCFGAAIGLQRVVRSLGKTPFIVHERSAPAVDNMYNMLKSETEYNGMFIDENDILEEVTKDTLLVVLDTHRPSMLPCQKLLEKVSKVVLIDHHRRSTEFISPCSLVYHEPYASSTCEMVTELIEYMGIGGAITKQEAQCLYTGIIMDTKNFMLKTGARTFEAASYLRKMGLDTVAVRRMFCTTKEDYTLKAEIVNSSVMLAGNIAIGKTYRAYKNIRMVASQAADEMLNLNNVMASVVVYPAEGGTGFSARSVGSMNVQLIMEKLGGGGHATVSGAYIKGIDVDEGIKRASAAVRSYLADVKE